MWDPACWDHVPLVGLLDGGSLGVLEGGGEGMHEERNQTYKTAAEQKVRTNVVEYVF